MKKICTFIFIIVLMKISHAQKVEIKKETKPMNVAILIYEGIYMLDFTGPYEIFVDTYSKDGKPLFNAYTVAPGDTMIKAHSGLNVKADFSIKNAPQPDIFVIPGGDLSLLKNNEPLKKWLIETANKSQIVVSVCTGAFILSSAGLLDGMEATTWYGAIDKLQELTPKAKVVKDKRITDNGKIITTAGVSAGIDGALYIVSRLFGKETATATAKYIEYKGWE
ncbi:MAG: DJ-1/PfpI family protein [Bacteroidetes bacterium]|nr:DJ-1/PfpI family protein [Bacteroidota bacterium]